jgi:hypothetical protein
MTAYYNRDIIEEYATYSSRVYAPILREGRRKEKLILEDIKPPSLANLAGIESLEVRIARQIKTPAKGKRSILEKELKEVPKTTAERQVKLFFDNLFHHKLGIRTNKATGLA